MQFWKTCYLGLPLLFAQEDIEKANATTDLNLGTERQQAVVGRYRY